MTKRFDRLFFCAASRARRKPLECREPQTTKTNPRPTGLPCDRTQEWRASQRFGNKQTASYRNQNIEKQQGRIL